MQSLGDGRAARLGDTFAAVFARIDTWFDAGANFFTWDTGQAAGTIPFHAEKLAYHNFQIWNYEDYGRSEDEELIVLGWRGAQANNTERNLAINAIDELLRPCYRAGAELHSETVGSIIDRVTIQYLKYKNFLSARPETAVALRGHIDDLVRCCQVLIEDIETGRKRCLDLPRLKLYFSHAVNCPTPS